ncbi:MAG TPA: ATP-binding protein [Candidatus Eisenbacteria bacterium]|nr:ATP-binding protein [Candidatus Eisenbacteria bacterium]
MILITRRRLATFLAALALCLLLAGLLLDTGRTGPDLRLWIVLSALYASIVVLSQFLLRRADRRLELMRATAEAIGRGELGTRVPVESHDELATFGRALNEAAEAFERQILALRREGESSDALINNLSQGVALLTADLVIRRANGRFWSIVGLDRPAGNVRLSASRQPVLEEVASAAARSGRTVTREVSIYTGQRIEYLVSATPILTGARADAILLTLEDLSPEREMANLRREFVANVSHELKTPLTSIRGYAETLLHGGLEDAENRTKFVETIGVQAGRLEALVNDLLTIADLERPDTRLDVKDWDLAQIAREVSMPFEEIASRRGLSLVVEVPSRTMARLDRRTIEFALTNLLDNAIKYTERGTVLVRVARNGERARVEVTDTGPGISPEHASRVFERFYRVDRGRSRVAGGTGLGLSIVKHAVHVHGGVVGLTSAPGSGSTFWFEIPVEGPPSDGAVS